MYGILEPTARVTKESAEKKCEQVRRCLSARTTHYSFLGKVLDLDNVVLSSFNKSRFCILVPIRGERPWDSTKNLRDIGTHIDGESFYADYRIKGFYQKY